MTHDLTQETSDLLSSLRRGNDVVDDIMYSIENVLQDGITMEDIQRAHAGGVNLRLYLSNRRYGKLPHDEAVEIARLGIYGYSRIMRYCFISYETVLAYKEEFGWDDEGFIDYCMARSRQVSVDDSLTLSRTRRYADGELGPMLDAGVTPTEAIKAAQLDEIPHLDKKRMVYAKLRETAFKLNLDVTHQQAMQIAAAGYGYSSSRYLDARHAKATHEQALTAAINPNYARYLERHSYTPPTA